MNNRPSFPRPPASSVRGSIIGGLGDLGWVSDPPAIGQDISNYGARPYSFKTAFTYPLDPVDPAIEARKAAEEVAKGIKRDFKEAELHCDLASGYVYIIVGGDAFEGIELGQRDIEAVERVFTVLASAIQKAALERGISLTWKAVLKGHPTKTSLTWKFSAL